MKISATVFQDIIVINIWTCTFVNDVRPRFWKGIEFSYLNKCPAGRMREGRSPERMKPAGRRVSDRQAHGAFGLVISNRVLPSEYCLTFEDSTSSAFADRWKNRNSDSCKTVPDRYGGCVQLCRCAKGFSGEAHDAVCGKGCRKHQTDEHVLS